MVKGLVDMLLPSPPGGELFDLPAVCIHAALHEALEHPQRSLEGEKVG